LRGPDAPQPSLFYKHHHPDHPREKE